MPSSPQLLLRFRSRHFLPKRPGPLLASWTNSGELAEGPQQKGRTTDRYLLGLPNNNPNNGTLGIMDEILVHPPFRPPNFHFPILECLAIGVPSAVGCRSCSAEQLSRLTARLSCSFPPAFPFQISSTTPRCFQNYCEKSVIVGGGTESAVAVTERLVKGEVNSVDSCEFLNSKYGALCWNRANASDTVARSLSGDTHSELANIRSILLTWNGGFVSDVLDPLNEYTQHLVQMLGQLVSITGTANDHDYNGIADSKTSSTPSHLYRVLISCAGAWSTDGASCKNPSDTMVFSFIFPLIDKDVNCLPKEQLLLDYTARLLDVELISGLKFHFPNLPQTQLLRLKTHIHTQLW
ncbi:hypothetical protein Y032_0001g451 [Ancylostoma ceylanicum]|uniref:Uncharacterized protein n=1 Tax=Ancylostoma ceylanicum TaxID=53326 RepID=A0A016W4G6_9BILA|nr:hypothetical protein Y032_0001g451 [Ancylostoma ceylanicum]